MGQEEFFSICTKEISEKDNNDLSKEDIYIVWFCKTLQNAKGLFSTDVINGCYWECIYNGDKQQLYIDKYKKLSNTIAFLNEELWGRKNGKKFNINK